MSVLKKQSGEPMLEFRLAYLRAIARSWADPAFTTTLLAADDIQPLLVEQFGLTTVWPKLDIHLENSVNPSEQTLWKPELTGGWIGMDDRFEIVLPTRPTDGATEALAAFYQIFPDLLGPVYCRGEGVQLEIKPKALKAIAQKALERKTGARGLRSILERALLDTMFELPAMRNVEKVVVDESSIEEDKPPMLVYRSREKKA